MRLSNKAIPPPEMTLEKKRTTPERLPKIVAPLERGLILSPPPKPSSRTSSYEATAGALARSLGSSSASSASASALRSSLSHARNQLLSPEQQKILAPEHISASVLSSIQSFLATPLGSPFRQTFAARAQVKALGTPTSDLEVALYAIGSVTQLAAHSVAEDQFGTVHRDVAAILRALTRVSGSVETFIRTSPVHWTDVAFEAKGGEEREVREVELLWTHLRCSLRHLIGSFEGYAKDMGLSEVELREARKAAGMVD